MKKKLLSLFLALSMLLTSVLCLLPVAAEGGTEDPLDKAAREAGNVCRVGEASEGKYYNNVNTAVTEALKSSNKTVTLIDNATLGASISVRDNKKLIVDGNNKQLTVKGCFDVMDSALTVKNLTIQTESTYNGQIVILRRNGDLTFESCSFVITATNYASDGNKNQIFTLNTEGKSGSLNLEDSTITVDTSSNLNTIANTAMFTTWNNNAAVTVTFKNTTINLAAFNNLALFKAGNNTLQVTLKVQNNSNIKVAKSINNPTIAIENSTLENTADGANLFEYSNRSEAISVSAKNATLTAKKHAFNITGCKAAVNVSLDGTTVVDGAQRAFSITNNTNAVNIVASGNSKIQSKAIADVKGTPTEGAGNAIYVCGQAKVKTENGVTTSLPAENFKAEIFTLTLKDNAQLISSGNVISFAHGSNWINKATITAVGNVTITAGSDKYLIETCSGLADGAITYTDSDNTKLEAKAWTTSELKTTKISVPAPKMGFGASVRLVEGSSGLRFSSTLTKLADGATVKLVKNGTLIAIYDELGENDFTIAALEAAGIEFANIPATKDGTVAGDGFNTYNAALTNIPAEYGDTKFVARAYAIYEINGVEYYVYADFSEDNVRDFYYVCNEALKDVKTDADFEKDENLRTEYPFEITTGKWSPYTKAQRELLDSLIPDDKKKQ